MEQLPIKLPGTAGERKLAERITGCVRAVMGAKAALRGGGLSDGERQRLEGSVEADERRIDEAVFALYGVDGLPGGSCAVEREEAGVSR